MAIHKIDISDFDPVKGFCGGFPEIGFVDIDDLVIDPLYQRKIERRGKNNIRKIAENFDWARFSPIVVSKRATGVYALIDGQHRAHAAALCGIASLPALIIPGLTLEQEASAFSWVNGSVTALTSIQKFKAAMAANEPWAVRADAAVTRAGCRLMTSNASTKNKKPGDIYCVSLIRRFVESGHAEAVIATLHGLRTSCTGDWPRFYSAVHLGSLLPCVVATGITRAEAVTSFLDSHNLEEVAEMVHRIRERPGFSGKSFKVLYSDSITVLLKKHLKAVLNG
jgi:uncharacterized protein DUF6551